MRKTFLIIILSLFSSLCFSQTAFTDAGTVDKTENGLIKVNVAGAVRTTGSLTSNTFELPPDYRQYFETPAKFTGADSIKLTVKLQGYWQTTWGTPGWVDLETIYSSNTDSIHQVVRDTLDYTSCNYYRLKINGETGNAHTPATAFKCNTIFIKKD